MSKTVKIGAIWVNEREVNGQMVKSPSIKLGVKSSKPEYNLSVEVIVRDHTGKVIAKQTDGYINLYKPKEGAPENLAQELVIKRS
jgi:hypothetical protein